MNSQTTVQFWRCYESLPEKVKNKAKESFEMWKKEHFHPRLHFKKIHKKQNIFSIRIGYGFCAICILEQDTYIWFWIGSHIDYDKLISNL